MAQVIPSHVSNSRSTLHYKKSNSCQNSSKLYTEKQVSPYVIMLMTNAKLVLRFCIWDTFLDAVETKCCINGFMTSIKSGFAKCFYLLNSGTFIFHHHFSFFLIPFNVPESDFDQTIFSISLTHIHSLDLLFFCAHTHIFQFCNLIQLRNRFDNII